MESLAVRSAPKTLTVIAGLDQTKFVTISRMFVCRLTKRTQAYAVIYESPGLKIVTKEIIRHKTVLMGAAGVARSAVQTAKK